MVKLVAERAPAKINLFLRVTGRRADGYHELDSIFLPIGLADSVRLEIRPAERAAVMLHCDAASLAAPESNLASRAATAFMHEFGRAALVSIDLQKRIPVGAGLGGGSSDAGAVLRMMAALYDIAPEIAPDDRLARLAVGLGADVPYFLDPRPSRVRGIGELREPIAAIAPLALVLAIAPMEVATARVFAALAREQWSGPAPATEVEQIMAGNFTQDVLVNDLATPAISLFPEIGRLRAFLREEGALGAQMSGSGGAVFGIFADDEAARLAASRLRVRAPAAKVFATTTTRGETAFESVRE
jgi:4-diphosphocytidyl-2-C-methyl-D-erythritol kinase